MPFDKPQVIVKGEDKTDSVRAWSRNGGKIDVTFSNGKTYSYSESNVRFIRPARAESTALQRFEYLKRIAEAVGLNDNERGGNILANLYAKIDFASEESIFAAFLGGNIKETAVSSSETAAIYPFGFNISQKQAIDNALSSRLSIVEGPPGTGKTQTILNIIANAVMRRESVAVVSNNNSATANVLDKLKKYEVGFIAAYLGNTYNKKEFIDSQKPLPELSRWKLSSERKNFIHKQLQTRFFELNIMLEKKNLLSQIKQELDAMRPLHDITESLFL